MKLSGVSQMWYTFVSLVPFCLPFLFFFFLPLYRKALFVKKLSIQRHIDSKQLTLKWTGSRTVHV